MAQVKVRADRIQVQPCKLKIKALSLLAMIFGPIFLIYLTMRCEKNQCILFQLPLVVPTHLSAYFSPLAFGIVIGFILLMFLLSSATVPDKEEDLPSPSTGLLALLFTSLILLALAYFKSDYISIVHGEYLRMLVTATVICVFISMALFVLNILDIIPNNSSGCRCQAVCALSFFYGSNTYVRLGHVEMKYFFYVHVGLVAWALLDQIIVWNVIAEQSMTGPVAFLAITQLLYIGHMLLYERFIKAAPFVKNEGLGFFWLMRVLMYQPFLHSLPLYYAATIEAELSQPALLANCVFFLFGFVVYISALHQRDNFINDNRNVRKMKAFPAQNGKRLLASGYWGIVQKPDYLGYVIMWTSWTLVCGFSSLSALVLLVMLGTVYMWLQKSSQFKQIEFGAAWNRYINHVPKQIIPHVF
ncbi:hypothetical protein BsWGS_10765 [Bradybaena similaris]